MSTSQLHNKIWLTVQLLKPGHLKKDYPITMFLKTKDSQIFLQTDQ